MGRKPLFRRLTALLGVLGILGNLWVAAIHQHAFAGDGERPVLTAPANDTGVVGDMGGSCGVCISLVAAHGALADAYAVPLPSSRNSSRLFACEPHLSDHSYQHRARGPPMNPLPIA